jgi:HD superfamily phosphohydrolase
LDVDRLDYLKRDSYYTGVNEGIIGTDRLIKMINVHNDKIAIEFKAFIAWKNFWLPAE